MLVNVANHYEAGHNHPFPEIFDILSFSQSYQHHLTTCSMSADVQTRVMNIPEGGPHLIPHGRSQAKTAKRSQVPLNIPTSHFEPLCHPLESDVTKEVNDYFLEHWPFPSQASRKKFVNAGFSRVTCWYFPKALPDRIQFACRLLTLLFLIDGTCSSEIARPFYCFERLGHGC